MSTQDRQTQQGLEQEQTYTVGKITFIVEPKFQTEGRETLGSLLLKLMQHEIDNA